MGVVLPPLEFTECLSDSPDFRENLHKHERELEKTNQHIKRIIKEVKDLIQAATQLSDAQKSFAKCMETFTFECIGGTETDDEQVIFQSLKVFSDFIYTVEEERRRMLENASMLVVKPLEEFRKKHIGAVKNEKKKFEKQTAKFCQSQERYLNLTTKKTNSLQEADASVDMAERHFYKASMEYVCLIQEVHERKKFEFVETLLQFMMAWLTFYHQGYEVAKDSRNYTHQLSQKIQKTRNNFDDFSQKLKSRMEEVLKQAEPVRNVRGRKEGYLFLLEKKPWGATWNKYYCSYERDGKIFKMIPYNQLTTKTVPQPETMTLVSCIRRMSDSIEKRFCFDIQLDGKPGVTLTFQALSEQDRKSWMDMMDGKEPTYIAPSKDRKTPNPDERVFDENCIKFVKKCIDVLETRGLEEQGMYRIGGVGSKVNKFLTIFLDKRKNEKSSMEDPLEWETKTITSALKTCLRSFSEPLMTYEYHNEFIKVVKQETKEKRINEIHRLLYKLPRANFDLLKIVIKHLQNVADKSSKNFMTASNLSVVFGPTLLRPEEETVASIMDLKFYNIVVEILIDNYDRLFNEPPPSTTYEHPNDDVAPPEAVTRKIKPINGTVSDVSRYTNGPHIPHIKRTNGYGHQDIKAFRTSNLPQQSYHTSVKPAYGFYDNDNSTILQDLSHSEYGGRPVSKYVPQTSASQSEINIPNMNWGSPRFGSNPLLDANCTSSSNESVASTSQDSSTHFIKTIPQKRQRSMAIGYHNMYKSVDNVRVRTLYACLGENDGELSFEPNQIITNVKSSPEPGWLEGTLNGKTGLIPENYVEILP
ncbi:rho GTPase-activating protein Graf isoform X2 [Aethina tumida]|uniref:rho GTPase-activating protein Graf isoform X2 n=1 Tax=Aethina tumida TaxID=116153 RepID=UPI00096B1318|nr:rho GTPase-activating protein Graf isoform X2 [Aethina tumida]